MRNGDEWGWNLMYYNEKLMELKEKMERMNKAESVLTELRKQKKELMNKAESLKQIKEKEQEDVVQVEGRSLANFFYRCIGRQEKRISKEREEAYVAAVKYDAAVREVDAVDRDIKKKQEELRSLWGCDREYESLYWEKMESIKASGNQEAELLLRLEEEMVELKNQIREIKEAISAGKRALSQAESILEELEHAENWGTWDLLGGGFVADLAKHGHLDDAQDKVEQLQIYLRQFQTELNDIKMGGQLKVNIEGFLRFADYFFDGLFADWTVLKRIGNSKEQVLKVKKQIMDAISHLQKMLGIADQEYRMRMNQKEELIWNAEIEMNEK